MTAHLFLIFGGVFFAFALHRVLSDKAGFRYENSSLHEITAAPVSRLLGRYLTQKSGI